MRTGIALGSNIEPRLANLEAARRMLRDLTVPGSLMRESRIYETTPVDCPPDSAPFLNAVVEIDSDLQPLQLLTRLQEIETSLGRPREHQKNAARTIDLDLLYCDNMTLSHEDLILPHPRLAERRFVLEPLSDIRPTLKLPNSSQTVSELLARLDSNETVTIYHFD